MYGFEAKFNVGPLMDLTMTEIMDSIWKVAPEDVEYAYTNRPPGPFRRLVVHSLIHNLTSNDCQFPKGQSEIEYALEVKRLLGQFES